MNCEHVRIAWKAFLNGELCGEEARSVRIHLASCADCASGLSPSEWVEVLPVLDEEIEPSEDFAARFDAKLRERRLQTSSKAQTAHWWRKICTWSRPWQIAAAGGTLMLLLAGIFLGRYSGETVDRPEQFEDIAVAEKLPLLEDMAVVNNLDLLEDFDAIENLTPVPDEVNNPRSRP